jgi:hypothetical protein
MTSLEENKPMWLLRLQKKWGVETIRQVLIILVIFTLAGSSIVVLRKGLFYLLDYDETTPFWLKTVTYLVFVFPAYQCLLLTYGFLLGQFNFFWEKEKKMFRWVAAKIKS